MRGPDGGSVHDPRVQLAAPMWDRGPKVTGRECVACQGRQNLEHRKTFKHLLSVSTGDYLICPRCDQGR